MPEQVALTVSDAIELFLESVLKSRSENTARTYQNGMNLFKEILVSKNLNPDATPVVRLPEDSIAWFSSALKNSAPTTERVYLTAASRLFEYIAAENFAAVNLPRIKLLIQQRARKPGQRLPQFPREAIEKVLEHVKYITTNQADDENEYLRRHRDHAFLVTLADTGLRVHEACALRRGDIDFFEGRAIIIGKGNRQAVVRFSQRSLRAIKGYLSVRQKLDGASGKTLGSLPLFARHDDGAGKKIKPITTTTGRNIVSQRVCECLGEQAVGTITPHSFRHYFVTIVLRATGNLKVAQELARHRNIAVTQRYAHLNDDELDQAYGGIFDQDK
jgi:site-specific recombinase XerD